MSWYSSFHQEKLVFLEVLSDLVERCKTFGVLVPSASEVEQWQLDARQLSASIESLSEREHLARPALFELLDLLSASVIRLDDEAHDPMRWRSIGTRLSAKHSDLLGSMELSPDAKHAQRYRSKARNSARMFFHVMSGFMWSLIYAVVLSREHLLMLLAATLALFITDDVMRRWYPYRRGRIATLMFQKLSRSEESTTVASSTWYTLAMFIGVAFLPKHACILGLLVLGVADPMAGLVGRRWGRTRLFRDKTVAGTLAFFATAFVVVAIGLTLQAPSMSPGQVLGASGLAAFVGAFAELMGEYVPDNLSVLLAVGTTVGWLT